jgi:hypothetical protein
MTHDDEATVQPAVGTPVDQRVVPLVPERDVLDELRAAAARKWQGDPAAQRAGLFARAADEVQHLREEVAELDALRNRLADLLTRTAVALRGPEPPLTRWGWHDVPERAAAAVAAIDVMQRAAFMAADPERHNAGDKGPPKAVPLD